MSEGNQTFQTAARPTDKYQATGAQTTVTKRPAREKETNEPPTRSPAVFIKQVVDELRKVTWPTGRQMVTYGITMILFLIAIIVPVWGVDILASLGVRSVLGE